MCSDRRADLEGADLKGAGPAADALAAFDIDVTVRRGDRVLGAVVRSLAGATVLFGSSGAGKTSVLMMVAGLLRPDRGHVRVGGRTLFDDAARADLRPERRRAGVVFQDARLFPHLTVRANLRYGAARGADADGALGRVARLLDIAGLLDRWPRALSGGEARRVAIGRALLSDPAFLLLDEPTASLDEVRREDVLRAIERVRDEARLPILMVTHDLGEAERIGMVVRM
ncbi:ATP-binding cassette domain-containing protein [Sphingomonas bacterium]|uniref:ATP-binding cassette domain-containing protein n=1 Tax=Sphingomonas bacterium TaxID=1895847 RepID=UPI001576663F|nr:ATP-binding cassette domain-containing protein [Sphingomonas bacterium]